MQQNLRELRRPSDVLEILDEEKSLVCFGIEPYPEETECNGVITAPT